MFCGLRNNSPSDKEHFCISLNIEHEKNDNNPKPVMADETDKADSLMIQKLNENKNKTSLANIVSEVPSLCQNDSRKKEIIDLV